MLLLLCSLPGGSITYGDKSSHKGRTDWVALLARWAARAFRNASTLNGAMPGTPSVSDGGVTLVCGRCGEGGALATLVWRKAGQGAVHGHNRSTAVLVCNHRIP